MATTTNNVAEKRLIAWLKDAHAMERSLETALTKQADHAKSDPAMRMRLEQHAQETRRHAEMVESALHRHGADTSTLKTAMGKMQAGFQGMMSGAAGDTKIKDTLTGIAAEHFEIACYKSLETAATELGDEQTASMCREILRDELSMAAFLEEQLPRVTRVELVEAAS
jgi:ferritin-like metal-binding protein YciE